LIWFDFKEIFDRVLLGNVICTPPIGNFFQFFSTKLTLTVIRISTANPAAISSSIFEAMFVTFQNIFWRFFFLFFKIQLNSLKQRKQTNKKKIVKEMKES